jgi:hypothetical protein
MIIHDTSSPVASIKLALRRRSTDGCVQTGVLNMGLLDGLLGGAVGAEMVTVVNGLIEKHGGVQVAKS